MAEQQGWWNTSAENDLSNSLGVNINLNISFESSRSLIQDQSGSYQASYHGESSGSSSSPDRKTSSDSSRHIDKPTPAVRREHTKSRLGCHNCKRRRIKCPQNHPICTQCSRKGLTCTWPEVQFREVRQSGPSTAQDSQQAVAVVPKTINAPLPNPTFNMQDFRLFYHFINAAHPHHPIGNEGVWTHEVPSIAHNYDYLLHAMLALAASDLSDESSELYSTALNHRVRAITLFNNALTQGLHTVEQGNAMLATCYTLIFQSVLIEDGLAEYMTFSRGCVVVAFQMGYKRLQFLFRNFLGEEQLKTMDPHLQGGSDVPKEVVDSAVASLKSWEHLCTESAEKEFHAILSKMATGAYTSSREAYMAQMALYGHFSYKMSHVEFQHLIDPANIVGQLLQAHMVALQVMLSNISIKEHIEKEPSGRPNRSIRWLVGIARNVRNRGLCEGDSKRYFDWPMEMAEEMLKSHGAEGSLVKI